MSELNEQLRLAEEALTKNGFKKLDDIWVAPQAAPSEPPAFTDDMACMARHIRNDIEREDMESMWAAMWHAAAVTQAAPSEPVAEVQDWYREGGGYMNILHWLDDSRLPVGTKLYVGAAPLAAQQSPADARDAVEFTHADVLDLRYAADVLRMTGHKASADGVFNIAARIAAATTSTEGR